MLIFLIIRSNKYAISTFSHLFPYYVLHILDLICCEDRHFSLFFPIIRLLFHFFRQKAATFQNNLYLCRCYLPMVAVMSSEEEGAAGWSTTY